ncbi:MAG TPA: hypothetical protein VGD21_13250 [Lysobacter sp.]
MRFLIASVYFLLSLFGCDAGGTTLVTRASVDGTDTLYSETRIQGVTARFECIRSASGQCHYTLFSRECASGPTQDASECAPPATKQFALAAGDRRELVELSPFDLCVSHKAEALAADCKPRAQGITKR